MDNFDKMFYVYLGRVIRQHRKSIRMTTRELAARAKSSCGSISRYEAGKQTIRIHTLVLIAAAFGIMVEDLLGETLKSWESMKMTKVPHKSGTVIANLKFVGRGKPLPINLDNLEGD